MKEVFYQKQFKAFFADLVCCKSPNGTNKFMSLRSSRLEFGFTSLVSSYKKVKNDFGIMVV